MTDDLPRFPATFFAERDMHMRALLAEDEAQRLRALLDSYQKPMRGFVPVTHD